MSLVGRPAPDFTLPSTADLSLLDRPVRLDEYRGEWVFLVFYPGDFTFVCPTELVGIAQRWEEFRARGAQVVGISTDSVYAHRAWIQTPPEQRGLGPIPFPLASDQTGQVSERYGVLDRDTHTSQRATFLIDPDGMVRWCVVHHPDLGRSVDEMLRVLDAAQTGSLCPVDWRPGQPVLNR